MLVRVYQPDGAPARIVTPTQALRESGESDADFLGRIAAHTEAADQTLVGVPFVDVDHTTLPTERTREMDGQPVDVRAAWRVEGNAVAVSEDVVSVLVAEAADVVERDV